MINNFKELERIINKVNCSFDNHNTIILHAETQKHYDDLKHDLDKINVKYEEGVDKEINICIHDFNVKTFYDKHHFLKFSNLNTFDDSFIILKYNNNKILLFRSEDVKCYTSDNNTINDDFILNSKYYLLLLNLIQSSKFSDYLNDINNEVVIFSSIKGIFKLSYPKITPEISGVKLFDLYKIIHLKFQSDDYIMLFKNELFDFLKTSDKSQMMLDLIYNLSQIIDATNKNYELFLKRFSFDSLKNKLYEEKDKYFLSLRELLSKILSQSISIPISISASLFASYKVDEPVILTLILFMFIIYSFLFEHFQLMYLKDVLEIEKDFIREFNIISSNSGLDENIVRDEKFKIVDRIYYLKVTIYLLIGFVFIITILFTIYILYLLTLSLNYSIAFVLLTVLLFLIRWLLP